MSRKSRNTSFAARLSYDVVFVTSMLFIVMVLFAAVFSHLMIAGEAKKSASNLLDSSIKEIELKLGEVENTVNSSVWLIKENLDNPDYIYHICSEVVKGSPFIVGSAVAFVSDYFPGSHFFSPYAYIDSDGSVRTKQLGTDEYDYFCMDWFQIPSLLGKNCWSEPYFDEGGADIMMSTYSCPIYDNDGKLVAVVTADIAMDWLSGIIGGIKPYENSYAVVVSRCGSYIDDDRSGGTLGETVVSRLMSMGMDKMPDFASAMLKGESGSDNFGSWRHMNMVVYGPLDNGWSMAIVSKYSDVLRSATIMHFILVIMAVLGLGLLFFLCKHFIQKLVRPLTELTESSLNIAKGDFNTSLPEIKSEDEIGRLRDAFEEMQGSLSQYMKNLESETAARERVESELNIASKIQMAMLPLDFPKLEHMQLSALVHPAREVGGDLYDFVIRGDKLFFTVGDVSGKGVGASLYMAICKAAFRFILGMDIPIGEVVSKMNDSLFDNNTSGMFITLFAGVLDLKTGELQYCNAGHNPIVVASPSSKPAFLEQKANMALGVFPGFDFEMQTLQLERGTMLVLYTDGVTEAERADKSQYGEARLLEWAASCLADAEKACNGLFESVREFTCGNEQNDDITIMTINFK